MDLRPGFLILQAYLSECVQGYLPNSLYNETLWVDDRREKLHAQAQTIVDESKRCEIIHEMQTIDFEKSDTSSLHVTRESI